MMVRYYPQRPEMVRALLPAILFALSSAANIMAQTANLPGRYGSSVISPDAGVLQVPRGLPEAKVGASLSRRFDEVGEETPIKAWVFFADKEVTTQKSYELAIRRIEADCNARALKRRALRRTLPGLFDFRDISVSQSYVGAVEATGAKMHVASRWLNAISVWATQTQLEEIAELPFVRALELVRSGRRFEPQATSGPADDLEVQKLAAPAPPGFYGEAELQLAQINLIALHDLGFTGSGVVIGALDSGFHRAHPVFNDPSHPVNVIAEYDFVDDDADTSIEPGDTQGAHGSWVLSIIGGYLPDTYVGAAYDASFILCKTENDASETTAEEDNFVGGLEFIEANGGDVATSSLDYPSFNGQWQMDGRSAVITQAVNIATANGMYCLNSGGNYNHDDDPNTSTIGEPVDALQGIAVGSVDLNGNIAGSSSSGPTADGRVKPEVLARGVNTRAAAVDSGYINVNGTSFAVPIVAGAVACLAQAHPTWTVDQMRTYLMRSGDYYRANGTFEPTYVRGYGIVDAVVAHGGDCNDNGIDDETDIAASTSTDCDANGVPDECFMSDCNANGIADGCDILDGPSLDENANRVPDECECPQLDAPLPSPEPERRNRSLSLYGGNLGRRTALRVRFIDMPDEFQQFEGLTMWVGNPVEISELPGLTDTTPPVSKMARLSCEPVVRDWSADGVIHVSDDEIVPGATYDIQEVEAGCGDFVVTDTGFSEPYTLVASQWGDVIAPFAAPGFSQPDFLDITAIVDKFKNAPGALPKAVVDLYPDLPDRIIDFNDIVGAVDAFRGFTYPFDGPTGCE